MMLSTFLLLYLISTLCCSSRSQLAIDIHYTRLSHGRHFHDVTANFFLNIFENGFLLLGQFGPRDHIALIGDNHQRLVVEKRPDVVKQVFCCCKVLPHCSLGSMKYRTAAL